MIYMLRLLWTVICLSELKKSLRFNLNLIELNKILPPPLSWPPPLPLPLCVHSEAGPDDVARAPVDAGLDRVHPLQGLALAAVVVDGAAHPWNWSSWSSWRSQGPTDWIALFQRVNVTHSDAWLMNYKSLSLPVGIYITTCCVATAFLKLSKDKVVFWQN